MPQKKNPDVAELIRGKTGRVYGDLLTLLTILKGLPLTYNKDLQEDKEPVFDAADTVLQCVPILQKLMETTDFRTQAMACSAQGDFSTATDVADYLVKRGIPFRQAHEIVGRMVQYCIGQGKTLEDLTLVEMKSFSPEIEESGEAFSIKRSVDSRNVPGGTAPEQVKQQIESAKSAVARQSIPPSR
jgi:argininosuccinate lyase